MEATLSNSLTFFGSELKQTYLIPKLLLYLIYQMILMNQDDWLYHLHLIQLLNLSIDFFVPHHLGIDHLTPEEAKNHNTTFSTTFFGDKTTTIWDGTYLYLNKSSNYAKSSSSLST